MATRPEGDRATPWTDAGEKQTLVDFLDYLRDAMVRKASGLPEEVARRPLTGSGTSLLGLVKHLTRVEVAWFQWAFAGRDVTIPEDGLLEDDTGDRLVAEYQAAVATSNEIIGACDDLGMRCRYAGTAPEPMTLRWLLVHMVEETGRHAGHADILREQLDGSIGR